jgi:nitrogen regulatory protein P-II 1
MLSLLTAVVKPHVVEEVKAALQEAGVTGMTVTEVRGFGRQSGHTETYRGAEYEVSFLPKARIDVVLDSSMVDRAMTIVADAARTGNIGDGKIWCSSIEKVMRVRTGEVGAEAI